MVQHFQHKCKCSVGNVYSGENATDTLRLFKTNLSIKYF